MMLRYAVILLVTTVSTIVALPTSEDAQAKILKYENENDGRGNYHFSFETSNGLTREETGTLVNPGQPDEHIDVRGSYKYFDDKGMLHFIQYYADQNGFQVGPEDIQLTPGRPELVSDVTRRISAPLVASLLG